MKEFFSIIVAGIAIGVVGFLGFARFEQVKVKVRPATGSDGITKGTDAANDRKEANPDIQTIPNQSRQPWCPPVFGCTSKIPPSPCNAPPGAFCL